MDILYSEHQDWSLPYWLDLQIEQKDDSLDHIMDINQWNAEQFGELGQRWGHERKKVVLPHPEGLNPVKIALFYTKIQYSWRFKDKADAMLFKLTWGGS